jgi:hypothetical protein
MKNNMRFLTIAAAAIILASCGQKQERKELYCGFEMSGFEVMDYKSIGNKGYTYSDADKALHAKLTESVNGLFDNKHDIKVAFVFKDNDKIALYVIAPSDKAMVEKISCYLLKENIEGLPKNRSLMFYTNEHDTLVAAVKTKQK